jgi:hypothetical protein
LYFALYLLVCQCLFFVPSSENANSVLVLFHVLSGPIASLAAGVSYTSWAIGSARVCSLDTEILQDEGYTGWGTYNTRWSTGQAGGLKHWIGSMTATVEFETLW